MTEPHEIPFPPGEVITPEDPRYQQAKRKKQHGKGNGHAPVEPLEYIDVAADIKPREWNIEDHIPANNVALLSGEGAIGKSILAEQLGAVMALNAVSQYDHDWLGLLPKGGPVQYVSCEEDDDELRRRLADIAKHYGTTRAALSGNLHMASWVDREHTQLAIIDKRTDSLVKTSLFDQLEADARRIKPRMIILDTSADLFGGNEISRSHTRQFITMLRRLAIAAKNSTSVLLLTHPSLEGIRSGSGLSGSTAWHNSCRARCVFKKVVDDAGQEPDSDLRQLEWRKNNYGPPQDTMTLRWRAGVYVIEPLTGSLEQELRWRNVEAVFLDLLRKRNTQDRPVSDKKSSSYAPAVFEDMPEAKNAKPRIRSRDFALAMERLFDAKRITVCEIGPPSRRVRSIIETVHAQ